MMMSSRKHKNVSQRPYLPFIDRPVVVVQEGQDIQEVAKIARERRAFLWPFETQAPCAAYVDQSNQWAVQVWEELSVEGTAYAGCLRVAFKYLAKSGDPESQQPIGSFETLQRIKEHLWPGRIAFEVYPSAGQVVAMDGVRWLWVLPSSVTVQNFPFSLNGKPRAI
jgi:hypothetical protein